MIRFETKPKKSYGKCDQRAVIKSIVSTQRNDTTQSYLRASPITPTDLTGKNTVNA